MVDIHTNFMSVPRAFPFNNRYNGIMLIVHPSCYRGVLLIFAHLTDLVFVATYEYP